MTKIRATCPDCGEVDLAPVDIELRIVRDLDGEVGEGSSYHFDCPACRTAVSKPADERIARLLATGGVEISIQRSEVLVETEPARPVHPEAPRGGRALTYDDLLDLHLALSSDDWFTRLAAGIA